MISNIYAQCDDYGQSQCNNDNSCEWVENLEIENCYDILDCNPSCNWQDCEAIEGCIWHFGTSYYDPSYCYGEHEVDNSYCQENEMPECSEMNETECSSDNVCEWVENIEIENCYDILDCTGGCTWQDCEAIEGCNWHFGTAYYDPSYCYGEHEVDNSYCEDTPYALGDVNEDSICLLYTSPSPRD